MRARKRLERDGALHLWAVPRVWRSAGRRRITVVERYGILAHKDAGHGEFRVLYNTFAEALKNARSGEAIIALQYELVDSELVEVVE